uniref:Uncharacterized protein n=1 Tax=Arundo donax TaxID=35708 RepID=A0A0A9DK68_ARUDO
MNPSAAVAMSSTTASPNPTSPPSAPPWRCIPAPTAASPPPLPVRAPAAASNGCASSAVSRPLSLPDSLLDPELISISAAAARLLCSPRCPAFSADTLSAPSHRPEPSSVVRLPARTSETVTLRTTLALQMSFDTTKYYLWFLWCGCHPRFWCSIIF